MNDLDTVKAYIHQVGATKVSVQTKLARRTVQYIVNSEKVPNYKTVRAILEAMEMDRQTRLMAEKSSHRRSGKPTAHELGK